MVELTRKQIHIDGVPQLVLSGEIHSFRVPRTQWRDRLVALRQAGCDTVASYIPWLYHELPDGTIDVTGRTRPERDVGAFIDLCGQEGLRFIARPGPFVMAELKNEGLPFRLYEQHPQIVPISWDGAAVPTRTVDYLAPAFLQETHRWYAEVMPVIAARLQPAGGNVIAVQLDNEVGMLSWVTNAPDLTDLALDDLAAWLGDRWSSQDLAERYGFDVTDPAVRNDALRAPDERIAAAFHRDLGRWMRHRFARYIATLRTYAEEAGIHGVPFVVNIHGTDDNSAASFPIGISQLFETYAGIDGMLSGSDLYLGDLTLGNVADLYLANAFMDAVHDDDQPLSSLEFQAGNSDYDRSLAVNTPDAIDLKTRLSVAQGNRLLNLYLFAGGVNPRLDTPAGDGNDRIAFTGEEHGWSAPIGPSGQRNPSYQAAARVLTTVRAIGDRLATMHEERDDLAFGFVPDHFMTESCYPGSRLMRQIVTDLEANRGSGPRGIPARAILLAGYRFGAIDVQHRSLEPAETPVLVLTSAMFMEPALQRKLVVYLQAGGRMLLCGRVPIRDMEGRPCTILSDALGLSHKEIRTAGDRFYPSVCATGWAGGRTEVRVGVMQLLESERGDVLLYDYDSGTACGFDIPTGAGHAIVVATDYPCDIDLYRAALERLGATAALRHDSGVPGVVVLSSRNRDGERVVHVLNLTGADATVRLRHEGDPLLADRALSVSAHRGLMVPLDVRFAGGRILYATGEIAELGPDTATFRLSGPDPAIALETTRPVRADGADVRPHDGSVVITPRDGVPELLRVQLG
jgi:beta-galactosidase